MDAPFIRMVNADAHPGKLTLILLSPPQSFDFHWDRTAGPKGRTRLCAVQLYRLKGESPPMSICEWCDTGKKPIGAYYAAVAMPGKLANDGLALVQALVQIPMALIADGGQRLTHGRAINVFDLGVPESKARWQIGVTYDSDRLPPPFDILPVLMRIKGMQELPTWPMVETGEKPDTIPFRIKSG